MSTIVNTILEIRTTATFDKWFANLKDRHARARIQVRIDRMQLGHFGDISPVGDGNKRTQAKDIARAKELVGQLEL